MAKRLTPIAFVGAAALAACFGSGPAPSQPSGATIVFVAPVPSGQNNACGNSFYISTVAFGASSGYGVLQPFNPPNSSCGGPGPMTQISVYEFSEDGSNPEGRQLGSAGQSNQQAPALAPLGSSVLWTYGNQLTDGMTTAGINLSGGIGSFGAQGLVAGAANAFVVGQTQATGFVEEPWDPQWPCCGNNTGQGTPGALAKISLPIPNGDANAVSLGSASFFCDELKECLVGNTTELYYMRHEDPGTGNVAAIDRVLKPGGPITTLDTISTSLSPSATPVGLAASETHVAWAVANSGQQLQNQQLELGCWIFARALGESTGKLLFQSSQFSCLDVAVDDVSVYFTIVRSSTGGDCESCAQPIHSEGIGRVSLDGSTYESLAIRMQGQYAGPRRVFLDTDSLYAVDPLAIAKIAKTALDNRQDIPQ